MALQNYEAHGVLRGPWGAMKPTASFEGHRELRSSLHDKTTRSTATTRPIVNYEGYETHVVLQDSWKVKKHTK